jgi:hypothetical protein
MSQVSRGTRIEIRAVRRKNSRPAVIDAHSFPGPEREALSGQESHEEVDCKQDNEKGDDKSAKTEFQASPSSLELKVKKR